MYQQEELSIKYKAPKSIVVVVVAECLGTNHWPRARWRAEMVPESRAGIVCIELYSTLCNHTWHLRPIIHSAGTTLTSSLFEGPRDLWSWWHHGHGCWNSCSIPLWSCGWSIHLFLWPMDIGHNAIPWIMTGILHHSTTCDIWPTLLRSQYLYLLVMISKYSVLNTKYSVDDIIEC